MGNGLAVAGLVCGIASCLSGVTAVFLPGVTVVLFLASIAAIILGGIAMSKTKKFLGAASGISIGALVTGIIGLCLGLLFSLPVAACSCVCTGVCGNCGLCGVYNCVKDAAADFANDIDVDSNIIDQFFNM